MLTKIMILIFAIIKQLYHTAKNENVFYKFLI